MSGDKTAVLFPGQGSQDEGMRDQVAEELPGLLELACALVGADLFERLRDGTRFLQPAIYCASLAAWERLRHELRADFFAGHSLGELAALVAAGSISAEEGLRIVVTRSELMHAAAVQRPGGMLAVLRGTPDQVAQLARAHGLAVANDNSPGQLVLAGEPEPLKRARQAAKAEGLRAISLPVDAAFHSPCMEPAVEPFREELAAFRFRAPATPVISGVTALPFDDVAVGLVEALTAPVRFREVLLELAARGATRFVEPGPGTVLAGLARRTLPHISIVPASQGAVARA